MNFLRTRSEYLSLRELYNPGPRWSSGLWYLVTRPGGEGRGPDSRMEQRGLHPRGMRAILATTVFTLALAPVGAPSQINLTLPAETPNSAQAASVSMEDFIRRFTADATDVSRFYDLPWSETRLDRAEQLDSDWRARLAEVDFNALDQPGRIDYVLLRTKLEADRAHRALDRRRLAEMGPLLPFRRALQDLERARWHMTPVNGPAAAEIVATIPGEVKKLRERIEKGRKEEKKESSPTDSKGASKKSKPDVVPLPISPVLARRAAGAVDDLRGTLRTWFTFYDGFQPSFSWWLKKPYDEATKALEDYGKFLREEIAGLKGKDEDPLVGDPIGAEGLADDLAAEMIPYTPKELIAIADREFASCEAQMKRASRDMGFGDDWKAALAKVKADYVPPGEQDELVAAMVRQVIQFVKDRDLVTIPPLCEETWRLTMSSPETQKTLPYAAYGGQNMMVAYAKEEMKNEDKLMSMRGNNRHFTRIVAAHELMPGHHLQAFVSERNRGYRSIFRTPFLVEGWALYWELRLWDLGYPQSPQDRIGMLFWRMHRCARIIVSLKFHLGQMTPAQMVDFLVDRVGHERLGATSEVRRYIGGAYSPLYQCSYLLGGMQLNALHHELVDRGQMTERQFNDAVLTYNAIPIEMIRAGMLNVPLRRDTRASWRFADALPKAR